MCVYARQKCSGTSYILIWYNEKNLLSIIMSLRYSNTSFHSLELVLLQQVIVGYISHLVTVENFTNLLKALRIQPSLQFSWGNFYLHFYYLPLGTWRNCFHLKRVLIKTQLFIEAGKFCSQKLKSVKPLFEHLCHLSM